MTFFREQIKLRVTPHYVLDDRTRTEQNRTEQNLHLQLKFTTVFSCNYWQHW